MSAPHPPRAAAHRPTRAVPSRGAFAVAATAALAVATTAVAIGVATVAVPGLVPAARADGAQSLPSVEIGVGDATLEAEIADDGQERYTGLGFRDAMDENAGMLFVYPDERPLTFTMRDTRIPLSIAFVSKDLVINEIHDMPVGPDQLFPSERPAMYALETNLGWFERNGVEPGDRLRLP